MLNFGELFVVCFITGAIVSFPLWLKAGAWIAQRLASDKSKNHEDDPPQDD